MKSLKALWRYGSYLIVVFTLHGCFLFPPPNLPSSHSQHLGWTAQGRAAIRTKQDQVIVNFIWRYAPDETRIRLYGSFGKVYADLVAHPGHATLTTDDGRWQDADSGRLLKSVLGWGIPVEAANRWLARTFADSQSVPSGPLAAFNEWLIEYKDIKQVGDTLRPRRLKITGPEVSILLSIDTWQVNQ